MAISKHVTRPEPSQRFEQRLAQHKEEVARLREQFVDPQFALFMFTRDKFDDQSFSSDSSQRESHGFERDDDYDLDAW